MFAETAAGGARAAANKFRKFIFTFALLFLAATFDVSADPGQIGGGCGEPLVLPADKVLRISTDFVEFEHHGRLPINSEVECCHHLGDEACAVPLDAVLVGFEEVEAVLLDGEVIRFDVYDPLYVRTVRVALSTDQFAGIEHKKIIFSPTSKLYVEETGTGRGFFVEAEEETVVFARDGKFVLLDQHNTAWEFDQRLYLWPDAEGMIQINSFMRGTSTRFFPRYRGRFELNITGPESFLIINEVGLEEYLYQVVPSEMVMSWPLEALKAQAVASRTYAVAQIINSRQGHLGFHVSDSTNFQVYNNQPEADRATRAINETAGQILTEPDGSIGSTYFYSTSPRRPLTDKAAWNNIGDLNLEGGSPWFRWRCIFSAEELLGLLQPRLSQPVGDLLALEVEERDELGRVTALAVLGTDGKEIIRGELNIRGALRPSSLFRIKDKIGRQSLLPSAMFFVESHSGADGKLKTATLYGGGSGHGLGMSQWGAKGMAEAGYDYLGILDNYYSEKQLINHSGRLRY